MVKRLMVRDGRHSSINPSTYWRQEDSHEFESSLSYIVNAKQALSQNRNRNKEIKGNKGPSTFPGTARAFASTASNNQQLTHPQLCKNTRKRNKMNTHQNRDFYNDYIHK